MVFFYNNDNLLRENKNLKAQNLRLAEYIKDLEIKLDSMNPAASVNFDPPINSEKDSLDNFERKLEESVKKMVDKMLENNSINSNFIPDYIERRLYENIFTVIIGLLKEMLENSNINILNQNISLKLTPE